MILGQESINIRFEVQLKKNPKSCHISVGYYRKMITVVKEMILKLTSGSLNLQENVVS